MPATITLSLRDLDRARWDALNPDNFRFSYAWLSHIAAGPFDAKSAYAVCERDGTYAGGLAAYLIQPEHFFLINPPRIFLGDGLDELIGDYYDSGERERAAQLRERLLSLAQECYPCAVCVSPFGYRAAVETRPGHADAVQDLLEAFESMARDWGARSMAVLFVPKSGYPELADELTGRGFSRAAIAARCALDVRWQTFDDYLASFSSDRRRKARRELDGFSASGLSVELIKGQSADDNLVSQLARLSANVQGKYGHRADAGREETVLRGLLRSLGEQLRLFVARRDGEPVSYMRGFECGRTFHAASTGEDYSALERGSYAHFKVGYYAPIEYAIGQGIHTIDWGLGAYGTKLHRGARLAPLTGFFRLGDQAVSEDASEHISLVDRVQRRFVRMESGRAAT